MFPSILVVCLVTLGARKVLSEDFKPESDSVFRNIFLSNDAGDHFTRLSVSTDKTEDTQFILPDSNGDAGDLLSTDGEGNLAWTQASNIVMPSGLITAYGGNTAPQGWLLCDGNAVSRSTYSALFDAVGTAYGSGDGSTTFHLPDLRGRFLRGHDGSAGRDPDATGRTAMNTGGNTGNNVGSIQSFAISAHTHSLTSLPSTVGSNSDRVVQSGSGSSQNSTAVGSVNGATTSSETRPLNAYVNYIIKI